MYAFRPQGHGQSSFFVAAKSEAEAENAVLLHIKQNNITRDAYGFGTDNYALEIFNIDVVAENNND